MIQTWIIYAFSAAVFTAAAVIVEKKTLRKMHAMEFSAILSIFALIISIPLIFLTDYSKIQFTQLLFLSVITLFASIGFLLVAKSVRHMEVSEAIPLLTLVPGITTILAFIFLKETISTYQVMGIFLLIFGAYILETKNELSLLEPIKKIKKSKYMHYIIIALIIYSILAICDRILLAHFDMQPEAYILFGHIFLAIYFIIMLKIFHNGFQGIKHGINIAGKWIFLVAIFVFGYRYLQAQALKIANVGLVVSIKRLSVLFAILIGGELFHEHRLLRKSIASLVMIGGAILITF
jgi:bacterial/archaeal transporter family protein